MRRRQVLSLAAVGLTGCLSDFAPVSNGTEDETTPPTDAPTNTPTPSETPDPTDTPMTTDEPTPPNLDAYPGDCPTYGASRVVCSDAAPDAAPLGMEASDGTVELGGSLTFTLRNDTDSAFQTNHYAARLHKRVDGEWFHVAPTSWPEPLTPLPAGERHGWTVYLDAEPTDEPSVGPGDGKTSRVVGGLGGGRYAFGNDGWFEGGTYEEKTAAIATVEVRGPPVALTATDDVTDVSVDGETLTARWTDGNEHEYSSVATFVLRTTDASTERRLITEQVLQPGFARSRPLRDALALLTAHDVETVRLTGVTGVTPPFGLDNPSLFEYDGRNYEMSAEEGAETK